MPEEDDLKNKFNVSFKKTEEEQQLKLDIIKESKRIGKSAWMKIAAIEKLERDKNCNNNYIEPTSPRQSTILSNYSQNKNDTKINSMDDLFK